MKEEKMTGEQIISWSQELRIRSLENVIKSVDVRLISQELLLVNQEARYKRLQIKLR